MLLREKFYNRTKPGISLNQQNVARLQAPAQYINGWRKKRRIAAGRRIEIAKNSPANPFF
jgi:hypothetical protein